MIAKKPHGYQHVFPTETRVEIIRAFDKIKRKKKNDENNARIENFRFCSYTRPKITNIIYWWIFRVTVLSLTNRINLHIFFHKIFSSESSHKYILWEKNWHFSSSNFNFSIFNPPNNCEFFFKWWIEYENVFLNYVNFIWWMTFLNLDCRFFVFISFNKIR